MDHGDVNEGFAGLGMELIVFAEPAVVVDPGDGAFDDPAAGQQDETLGGVRAFDDLQDPAAERLFAVRGVCLFLQAMQLARASA